MKLIAYTTVIILTLLGSIRSDDTTDKMIAVLKEWAAAPQPETAVQYSIRVAKEKAAAKAVEQHQQDSAYKLYLLTLQTDAQLRQAQAMEEANSRREQLEFLRLQRIIQNQKPKK